MSCQTAVQFNPIQSISSYSIYHIMPVNRNALIRYKTIDKCLQNKFRKWTLEDIIDACSDTLYEYEGIDKGISKRTVQGDIQMMRSDKLGYNAPIVVIDKKYYAYEDPKYSITNIPLSNQDLTQLNEAVDFLKQFKGFSHFKELDGMVQKLEDHVYSQKNRRKPVIDFEKNENLKGLEYLDQLHKSILNRQVIKMTYQSFKARQANTFHFHPYLLKEFRNRWFVIGLRTKDSGIMNLALDRIIELGKGEENVEYINPIEFDGEEHFKHTIGVSVNPNQGPEKVVLYVLNKHAPYVITKPMHWSQKVIEKDAYGVKISLDVQHNFELEKDILGFGDGVKVLEPAKLRNAIKSRLHDGFELYETELTRASLRSMPKIMEYKGHAVLNQIYTTKELRTISRGLDGFLEFNEKEFSRRALLNDFPDLAPLLFNLNLRQVIQSIRPELDKPFFVCKATYFNKVKDANWYVTWHQDIPINVKEKTKTKGFTGWTQKEKVTSVRPPFELHQHSFSIRIHLDETNESNGALKVLQGSHKKYMTDEEIKTITENSIPFSCNVEKGGIHIMHPLLLHASSKTINQRKRRVIHLDFSCEELPDGMEWAEKFSW